MLQMRTYFSQKQQTWGMFSDLGLVSYKHNQSVSKMAGRRITLLPNGSPSLFFSKYVNFGKLSETFFFNKSTLGFYRQLALW